MSRNPLLLMALLLTGCALEVSFSESHYTCDPAAAVCPTGFACSSEGFCERPQASMRDGGDVPPDAAEFDAAEIDAATPAPDAVPGSPDAAPAPDAAPPPPPPPDAAPLPPDANVPPTVVTLVTSRDTQLYSPSPTHNFGNFAEIICAVDSTLDSPVLMGFDLSSIPPGSQVVSAVFKITTANNAVTSGGTVSLFALLEDWTEGTLNNAPGVANYNQRKAGINWSSPGAKGLSRASTAAVTFAPNQTNTTFNVSLPVSLVQSWVNNPGANFGFVMNTSFNQDVAFHTRGAIPQRQPKLTITYLP